MENRDLIKITGRLIKKLLSGEAVEICNEAGIIKNTKNIVFAVVEKGRHEKSISVYVSKEGDTEIYETEEIYRTPFIKNRLWLKKTLKHAQSQWHTYYGNY